MSFFLLFPLDSFYDKDGRLRGVQILPRHAYLSSQLIALQKAQKSQTYQWQKPVRKHQMLIEHPFMFIIRSKISLKLEKTVFSGSKTTVIFSPVGCQYLLLLSMLNGSLVLCKIIPQTKLSSFNFQVSLPRTDMQSFYLFWN